MVGNVLGDAWTLYTKFFLRFFAIALVVFLVTNLLYAVLAEAVDEGSDGGAALLAVVAVSASVIGSFWLQGALVYAVQDARDGVFDTGIREIFGRVAPHLGTLVLAGLLAGLGIGVGLLLLIVPGVVLLTWWAVIAPVIVLEDRGVAASFARSRDLVRGNFWPVLGVLVIAFVLSGIAQQLLVAVFAFLPEFLQNWLGASFAAAVVVPFGAVAVTLLYFRLLEGEGSRSAADAAVP